MRSKARRSILSVTGKLCRKGPEAMAHHRIVQKLIAAALLSGGPAVSNLVLTAAIAQAHPGPVPLDAWPGCPNDHPAGPCHWCPGDPPVQTGNLRVDPVRWDASICHTYWYVQPGQGNVSRLIWDGDDPPAPPPP